MRVLRNENRLKFNKLFESDTFSTSENVKGSKAKTIQTDEEKERKE